MLLQYYGAKLPLGKRVWTTVPLRKRVWAKSHLCKTVCSRSEGFVRTGYFIPGRDGIGELDLARNSSAAVAVAVRQRRWIGCAAGLAAPLDWLRRWIGCAAGLAAPLDWLRRWIGCTAGLFPLHWRHTACRQEEQWKGREEQWKGREEQWKGREEQWKRREEQWKGHVRVCYDYKSMLGL